jgi:hypothetical protein
VPAVGSEPGRKEFWEADQIGSLAMGLGHQVLGLVQVRRYVADLTNGLGHGESGHDRSPSVNTKPQSDGKL